MDRKELNQPWKVISTEYRRDQIKLDHQSRAPARFQVPEGQVVLKGGTGTAPHDAQSWKEVLYDTKDDERKK